MKKVEAVAGIIICNNEILCMKRSNSKYNYIAYKYEFPGGKIEVGESPKAALQRELNEEIDLDVPQGKMTFFMTVKHDYPDFTVQLHAYLCQVEHKEIKMKEHEAFSWSKPDYLTSFDWLEGDWPIIESLRSRLDV